MSIKDIKINKFFTLNSNNQLIIAEIGVNHNGKLSNAIKLIHKAKECGANAVKFQTFVPDELVLKTSPKADYHFVNDSNAKKNNWLELLKMQQLNKYEFIKLFQLCKKLRLIFISTPYDFGSIKLLEEIGVEMFKIASADINNYLFLEKISKLNKPIILSTGMSDLNEIDKSVNIIKKYNKKLILLHCTSEYPAKYEDSNTLMIKKLREKYNLHIGYSDHVNDYYQCISAISLGANVYEKHFTLSKSMKGPDHSSSLNPNEFKKFVNDIKKTKIIMGNGIKKITKTEKLNQKKMRKFLVARHKIQSKTIIGFNDLKFVRTGGKGISVANYKNVIGKKTKKLINENQIINKSQII